MAGKKGLGSPPLLTVSPLLLAAPSSCFSLKENLEISFREKTLVWFNNFFTVLKLFPAKMYEKGNAVVHRIAEGRTIISASDSSVFKGSPFYSWIFVCLIPGMC